MKVEDVSESVASIAEKVSDLAKTIFTPIIDTYKKMFNLIKTAWLQLLEKVDNINTRFVAGEFQYDRYANKIKDIKEHKKDIQ